MLEVGLPPETGGETGGFDSTVEVQPGRSFDGYEIIRKVGAGGMGVVYEARQSSLRRPVALKMVRAPGAATPEDIARFRQEAEAAARLNHPNIVEVYGAGEVDGTPYFTMKFIAGARSLASEMAGRRYDARGAARTVAAVARAVAYAHQRGVIHRDLKPANILLDGDGRPSLVDFGLAKLFGDSTSVAAVPRVVSDDGRLVGTPHYMSPEQVRGEELTTATDIYSLGIVLYEMLSGAPPFVSRSLNDVLRAVEHDAPRPPGGVAGAHPRDLQVICLKCLRKQPKNRYGTADELADDLDRWLGHRPVVARPSSPLARFGKWVRRHPAVAALSGMVAVLGILTVALSLGKVQDVSERLERGVLGRLNEAGRERADNLAGRRWRALEAIGLASQNLDLLLKRRQDEYRMELRNEAVACLSLIDLRPSEDPEDAWLGDPEEAGLVRLGPGFQTYAHIAGGGRVMLRRRPSNDVLLELEPAPGSGVCRRLLFEPVHGLHLAGVFDRADGSGGAVAVLWDLTGEEVLWSGRVNGAGAVGFAADGGELLYADGRTVRSVGVGREASSLGRVEIEVGFEPQVVRAGGDRSVLALAPGDGPGAVLVDRVSGGVTGEFTGAGVRDMEWSPLGRWLAIGCDDGRMVVWNTGADQDSPDRFTWMSAEGQHAPIEHVAWHPRGVLVAGTSSTEKVHLWHVVKGELEVTWSGHVGVPQFASSSDGESRLGPVIEGARVSLLEVAEGRVVSHARGHPGPIHGAWWRTPTGGEFSRLFATAGDDGVRVWNRRGFEKAFIRAPGARAALFLEKAMVVSAGSGVSVRAVRGGTLPQSRTVRIGRARPIEGDGPTFGADFDAQSGRLVVAARDEVRVFSTGAGEAELAPVLERSLPAPAGSVFAAVCPGGGWVAAGSGSGAGVRVWGTGDWKPVDREFRVSGSSGVAFYRDPFPPHDEWFITSCGGEYAFYEVGTWRVRHRISANLGASHGAISFSPRTPVFAASEGLWLRLYRLRGFEQQMGPQFESQAPVSFSPGGLILVTSDRKTHLHLWDARLLREHLAGLDLDLGFEPIPAVSEPPLIDLVELEEGGVRGVVSNRGPDGEAPGDR